MSEKRFTYDKPLVAFSKGGINDNVTGETYEFTMDTVLGLLNEQQATISALTKENKELGKNFEDLVEWASKIAKRNVILDEQIGQLQRENEQLRQQLKEKEEDEQLYANEIVKLNKEAKEVLDFKSLGGDY